MIKNNFFYIKNIKNVIIIGFHEKLNIIKKICENKKLNFNVITSSSQSKNIKKLKFKIFNTLNSKFKKYITSNFDISETLFVSLGSRLIFKKKDLNNFFKNNVVNFHSTRLPFDSGGASTSWKIMKNDRIDNQLVHLIDEGIDTGDIIEIRSFAVDRNVDTAQSLFEKGNKVMFKMFKDWFYLLLNGEYDAVKQDESKAAIYYRKDLNKIKDLSKYIRGLTFEGKESAYYINNNGVKKYIAFKND